MNGVNVTFLGAWKWSMGAFGFDRSSMDGGRRRMIPTEAAERRTAPRCTAQEDRLLTLASEGVAIVLVESMMQVLKYTVKSMRLITARFRQHTQGDSSQTREAAHASLETTPPQLAVHHTSPSTQNAISYALSINACRLPYRQRHPK